MVTKTTFFVIYLISSLLQRDLCYSLWNGRGKTLHEVDPGDPSHETIPFFFMAPKRDSNRSLVTVIVGDLGYL